MSRWRSPLEPVWAHTRFSVPSVPVAWVRYGGRGTRGSGATYRIDPTAPVGSRVKELAFKGRPVQPSDRFTLAVNAYRAQGSGGYKALKGAKIVKEIPDEIRELLIERLRKLGTVRPQTDHNWVVAPDATWASERGAPEPPRRAPAP